jgi:hypothetical protein
MKAAEEIWVGFPPRPGATGVDSGLEGLEFMNNRDPQGGALVNALRRVFRQRQQGRVLDGRVDARWTRCRGLLRGALVCALTDSIWVALPMRMVTGVLRDDIASHSARKLKGKQMVVRMGIQGSKQTCV